MQDYHKWAEILIILKSHQYNINQFKETFKMGNKIFEKAVEQLIDLVRREILPLIDQNIKHAEARKLKSDIYFGLHQFKRDGQDFEITQNINHKSIQGKLREKTGALRMFLDLRAHFYIKKINMEGIDYIQGYISIETKGIGCKWSVAMDARVRARVSV